MRPQTALQFAYGIRACKHRFAKWPTHSSQNWLASVIRHWPTEPIDRRSLYRSGADRGMFSVSHLVHYYARFPARVLMYALQRCFTRCADQRGYRQLLA